MQSYSRVSLIEFSQIWTRLRQKLRGHRIILMNENNNETLRERHYNSPNYFRHTPTIVSHIRLYPLDVYFQLTKRSIQLQAYCRTCWYTESHANVTSKSRTGGKFKRSITHVEYCSIWKVFLLFFCVTVWENKKRYDVSVIIGCVSKNINETKRTCSASHVLLLLISSTQTDHDTAIP